VRVQRWKTARTRARGAGIVAIVAAACVLVFAAPASAHNFTVHGVTDCPHGEHIITWTIGNPDHFGPLTIVSATAEIGGTTYAVTGYTSPIPEGGSTNATTTTPGSETGEIHITVNGRFADGFTFTARGHVDLQPPCEETTTTTASTTTTSTTTTSTTAPPTTVTSGPPVTGGTTPATGGTSPSSAVSPTQASLPAGQQGAVAAEEAGSGTLPRTGADATNWTLVGLATLGFGLALLALSSARRPAVRRR
jgi:LPXTG-motif cell wall-anchored protein